MDLKFIDEAVISAYGGHGGRGWLSFRREKFVPLGGPDGGNGGAGGSVIVIADRNRHTLLDIRFQRHWRAEDGAPGEGGNREGKAGKDLVMRVPIGTQFINQETGEVVLDLTHDEQRVVLAKGGRGGKGNNFFKSATNQVPEHFQPGEDGEQGTYLLSLKLVADVGLIGFPNAGKSTLIARISAARPKIADYPFTTLVPNLGVVQAHQRSFVVADIPGLIPGAHEGKGLGIKFLKHVERTRILVHLVDPQQLDKQGNEVAPVDSFNLISSELAKFSPELAARPQLVVLTKIETLPDPDILPGLIAQFEKLGHRCIPISSVTGVGIATLLNTLTEQLFGANPPNK